MLCLYNYLYIRILLTREMCNALKEHICRIETAVDSGESDRKELVQHNTELTEQYTVRSILVLLLVVKMLLEFG